jgi:hypothetical protein
MTLPTKARDAAWQEEVKQDVLPPSDQTRPLYSSLELAARGIRFPSISREYDG